MINFNWIKFCNKKNYLSHAKDTVQTLEVAKKDSINVTKLDPKLIPKYVNQLEKPPVYQPRVIRDRGRNNKKQRSEIKHLYHIDISEFKQQLLPKGFPRTKVWGYGGMIRDSKRGRIRYSRSSPGATFEAVRGIPIQVKWENRLTGRHLFPVDPTLHWANPNDMPMHPIKPWPAFPSGFWEAQRPVPIVTHLHGGEVDSNSDGHPDAWFTYNHKYGPAYVTSTYIYPNKQEATTLWYHDHALGITRLNIYAGLAGFYLLRDGEDKEYQSYYPEKKLNLPSGKYEMPLIIQDRMFNTDGSLLFNNVGINPDDHPYWFPGLIGDTILVNGKVWPNMNVENNQYRFRVLNGSNDRFYHLTMSNGMKFIQIGSDGGYLSKPVEIKSLLLAPAERADLIIDFSDLAPGTSIILKNDANAPFPNGTPADPETVGQIMQFTVCKSKYKPIKPIELPHRLNYIKRLRPNAPTRILTLNDEQGANGPLQMLLNGQLWSAPVTETPRVGSTEDWCIVSLTPGAHPIHLHLVQFQLICRQNFNAEKYRLKWEAINGDVPLEHPTKIVPIGPYLIGKPIPPDKNETGWKDTIRVNPNQITRIRIRFAPQEISSNKLRPGVNYYPFDPSSGPGYVWHCHILDHEDNEMMRPMKVRL